ncbi:unnamed protein product [Caenorhabditis brenneri]
MSLSKLSLLNIPDLPMIKILENCNFMSLIILRKTCHSLRNFIDYLAPETEITRIQIKVYSNKITLDLYELPSRLTFLNVSYKKCSQGCELELFKNRLNKEWNNKLYQINNQEKVKKYIKDADFMDVFCMDLAVILRIQRTTLDSLLVTMKNTPEEEPKKIQKSTGLLSFFQCCSRSRPKPEVKTENLDPDKNLPSMCNRIYERIELSLQSRPLRVKKVLLDVTEQLQVLQVLPYTDPNVLDSLQVRSLPNETDCENPIELGIDELVKLEHWKMIKTFLTIGFKLKSDSIENFEHFEIAQVRFDVVTARHFLFLKKKFLTTPNLLKFYLFFHSIENRDGFYQIVGHPNFPNIGSWKFRIPGTNQYLHVQRLNLPMIKILKDCDFMSLIILRKTCRNLRNFIDYLAPETEVGSIEVDVYSNKIRLVLHNYQTHLSSLDVTYRKCSQGCELELFENRLKKEWNNLMYRVLNGKKVTKYIEDADFTDVFCMDLAVIMRMQRTELRYLKVSINNTPKKEPVTIGKLSIGLPKEPKKNHWSTGLLSFLGCCSRPRSEPRAITEDLNPDIDLPSVCNQVYDTIEHSVKSRPLRVSQIVLYATGQRQLMQILPYTDPNVLNCLSIHCFSNQMDFYDVIDLEIDDLVKLKQWKMIKRVCITGFTLKGSIEDFVHYERVQVKFDVVTANQFLFLKEKFLTTPNLSRVLLYFNTLQDPDNFNETVGHPIQPNIEWWNFPIAETNQYLRVRKSNHSFVFERETFHLR